MSRAPWLALCLLAPGCGSDRAPPPRSEDPAPIVAPRAPTARRDLRVRPPRLGCEVALVRTGPTARITTGAPAAGEIVVCLEGRDVPPMAELVDERVDVMEEGNLACGHAERFTFRHEAVIVRAECPSTGALAIEAQGPRDTARLALLRALHPTVHIAWAGDWNGDGRAEMVVEARTGESPGEVVWLGVFELDEEDRLRELATWGG